MCLTLTCGRPIAIIEMLYQYVSRRELQWVLSSRQLIYVNAEVVLSLLLMLPEMQTTTTTVATSTGCTPTWTSRVGVNSVGARPQYSLRILSQCQETCIDNDECVAVDWNSSPPHGDAFCWIHLDANNLLRQYATAGVTQYSLTNRCTSPILPTTTATGLLVYSSRTNHIIGY